MKSMIRSLSALSVLAIALQACTQTPGAPIPGGPSPSPSASAPANNGGQTGGQTGTPTPGATPSADTGLTTTATLMGKVYDEAGARVDAAKVMVKSLNPARAFEAQADVMNGAYVINQLPEGLLLEVSIVKDGWTKRSQTAVLVPTRDGNVMDFGGGTNPHFVSDYPEIEAVEPVQDAAIDGKTLSYTLKLSEALDDANKRRFENALRILPAEAKANAGNPVTDIEAAEDAAYPYDLTVENGSGVPQIADYAIQRGSTFMGDTNQRAKVTWSADGLSAKLEFNAPLIADKDNDLKYQVALVSGGERILDKNKKQLGTNVDGAFNAYPATGHLVLGTFKPENLAAKSVASLTAGSAAERWAATHDNVANFKVKKDDAAPNLEAIEVVKMADATRIELTFSEPMAAYKGGANGYFQNTLTNLANYSFAVGGTGDDLAGMKLDGSTDIADLTSATSTFGAEDERGKEFKFAADLATITVDPLNAKHVFVTINKPNFFNVEARDIKVRAAGIADPAGNGLNTKSDANIKLGTL